jgi:hypothetical protein
LTGTHHTNATEIAAAAKLRVVVLMSLSLDKAIVLATLTT